MNDETCMFFKAIDKITGDSIGHCRLMIKDLEKSSASVGRVFVKKRERDKEYGCAMLKELIYYIKENMNLSQLSLQVFSFNTPASH